MFALGGRDDDLDVPHLQEAAPPTAIGRATQDDRRPRGWQSERCHHRSPGRDLVDICSDAYVVYSMPRPMSPR